LSIDEDDVPMYTSVMVVSAVPEFPMSMSIFVLFPYKLTFVARARVMTI